MTTLSSIAQQNAASVLQNNQPPTQVAVETKDEKKLLIIVSDSHAPVEFAHRLWNFRNLAEYDLETFYNRSLAWFEQNDYSFIWINLNKSKSRKMLSKLLVDNDINKWRVAIISNDFGQKFITDVKNNVPDGQIPPVFSLKDLSKIKSLTLEELYTAIAQNIKIHKPDGILAKVFRCIKKHS